MPHGAASDFFDLFRRDAKVHQSLVSEFEPGHVSGFPQQSKVARRKYNMIAKMRSAKICVRDEAPAERGDDGIPIRGSFPRHQRRHRRPTTVDVAPMPCDPRWRPFRAGHPAPASMLMKKPPPVMKRRPTPRHIRHPRPPGVRVSPAPVSVRAPSRRDIVRRPHPAVRVNPEPLAVGRELIVEETRFGAEWLYRGLIR